MPGMPNLHPEPAATTTAGLPGWFLLLPVLAIAAWWPIEPFWASDDFVAIAHAQDFGRVLRDFVGPQYGATDIWAFYRPLFALSFWVDVQIGGGVPFVSHLSNVLAHGVSALVVGLLWRRLLGDAQAFGAGLLWALAPSHLGSIAWAVGRVDSHTAVWCLLCILAFVRWLEGRTGNRAACVAAAAAALLSKELAFVLPPMCTLIACLRARGSAGARTRAAFHASWPLWLLFALYLGWRWWCLGRLGGYLGATYDPPAMAAGLGTITLDLINPLRWAPLGILEMFRSKGADGVMILASAGYLAAVLAVAGCLWRRRISMLGAGAALFLVASAPMAGFFAAADSHHNLRYFYLPFAALVGLLVPMRALLLLWLPVFGLGLLAARSDQLAADRESAAMHRALLREAQDLPPDQRDPMFVAGLPHHNATGNAVQFHFGVDRMFAPPFGPGSIRVFPLRPAEATASAVRLADPGEVPFALPGGSTWFFDGSEALYAAPPVPLPDLEVAVDGGLDLPTSRLDALARADGDPLAVRIPVRTPGVSPAAYRVTFFTAVGYLSALFVNQRAAERDGGFELRDFLRTARWSGPGPVTRLADPGTVRQDAGDAYLLQGLTVVAIHDLLPEFPVLFEAVALLGDRAVVTHRARRLLWCRVDRDLPAFLRRLQGR
jgi:hypothetical protein